VEQLASEERRAVRSIMYSDENGIDPGAVKDALEFIQRLKELALRTIGSIGVCY
jgi:hypothetical protein